MLVVVTELNSCSERFFQILQWSKSTSFSSQRVELQKWVWSGLKEHVWHSACSFNFFCPKPLQWGSVYSWEMFYLCGREIHQFLMWNRQRKPNAKMCLYKYICWCGDPLVNICTWEPCWILKAHWRTWGRIFNRTLTCKTNSPSKNIFWYFSGNCTVCLNPAF